MFLVQLTLTNNNEMFCEGLFIGLRGLIKKNDQI